MTLAVVANFSPTAISGHGFIALAAVIFGKWSPQGALRACLLFGFAQALVVMLGGMDYIPSQLLAMLPYVLLSLIHISCFGLDLGQIRGHLAEHFIFAEQLDRLKVPKGIRVVAGLRSERGRLPLQKNVYRSAGVVLANQKFSGRECKRR